MLGLRLVVCYVVLLLRPGGANALTRGLNEVRRKINGGALTRVVNVGTSSKMCQRNFVPTPHPGTLEIVPTLRNE